MATVPDKSGSNRGVDVHIPNARTSMIPLSDGIAEPATASVANIYIDEADGDLKVKFDNGFVAVIAADS